MFRMLRNWMAIFVLSLLLWRAAQQNDGPPWWGLARRHCRRAVNCLHYRRRSGLSSASGRGEK